MVLTGEEISKMVWMSMEFIRAPNNRFGVIGFDERRTIETYSTV
jgi:hypothetical protein